MATSKTSSKKKESPKAKSLLQAKDIEFFEILINTPSPTGFEWTWQQVWIDYITPFVDEVFVDTYGSCVATINPGTGYNVVIEAHCDEISWFVNYITEDGLIYVIRNGGSDHQIAPAKRVIIHGKKGLIEGLFWRPAIHTRDASKEESPKVENIFIDVGARSKKEIGDMGIVVGSVITYPDPFIHLNNRYFVGRAMDNRAGGFMISQVARLLYSNKKKLPFTLHIVNSVQEEIGLKGAEMIAHRLNPDLAIITDVCHDTSTPMIDKKKQWDTQCGKGPVLSVGPSVQNNLRNFIEDVAVSKKLPFQRLASSRLTGTDTDAFAYTQNGIASALISLPLRYMHTTVEMVEKHDVEQTIKLIYETVCSIKHGQEFSYIKNKKLPIKKK
jgi:putative aminopeptidase FrvX